LAIASILLVLIATETLNINSFRRESLGKKVAFIILLSRRKCDKVAITDQPVINRKLDIYLK
jgi:hypothetical protein